MPSYSAPPTWTTAVPLSPANLQVMSDDITYLHDLGTNNQTLTSGGSITLGNTGGVYVITTNSATVTLPAASTMATGTAAWTIKSAVAASTIVVSGADHIFLVSNVTSLSLGAGDSYTLKADPDAGIWYVI